ncbi:MAG: NAD(P)-binding domain-containing protein, partial [Clostridiales bacterium]|nr:NAD(P)-binding domain-containing protein [Clostridiales bacterium]
DSISQVIESSDIIILAIKPQVIESVLNELKGKKLKVISIVAGKTTAYIQGILGSDSEVVRVMPNINAFVGAATSAYVPTENASNELCNETVKIFNTIGSIVRLQEKQFSAFTAICGSAPAFTYMYIDALAKAAVKGGLPRDVAQNLAADMVKGSAKMVL